MNQQSDWIIDVQGLTKRFGDKTVVDKLDLQVRPGEIYGFLGPNGSGKTTSIRMMCGLLTPDEGQGQTLGFDIVRQSAQIKRQVGYMTQKFGLYDDLTLQENLEFIARLYQLAKPRARAQDTLARLGLTGRRHQLAGSLSGGWKQRLALSACLIHQPRLLLLDEPTAGVDPKARREFWEEIGQLALEGMTVLVSTHYMDEAERCHRLGYIAYGRLLACGTPQALIQQSGFSTWRLAQAPADLAHWLEAQPGVALVTRFGNALHLSSREPEQITPLLGQLRAKGQDWQPVTTALEDLFIALMNQARDNFSQEHP